MCAICGSVRPEKSYCRSSPRNPYTSASAAAKASRAAPPSVMRVPSMSKRTSFRGSRIAGRRSEFTCRTLPAMAILKVARLGHPALRHKASDVEVKDIKAGKFQPLIDDMIETMHEYEGVGLAGPQVHLPLRIFVFEVEERVAKRRGIAKLNAGVFFNAVYEPMGTETITDWEGCLSVPFLGGEVARCKRLRIRGLDHEGNEAELEVTDFTARIFQ